MNQGIRLVEPCATFVAGLVVVLGLYTANGWWLNSGQEVLRTSLVLLALGLFAGVWRSGRPWMRAAGLWSGAMVGMVIVLVSRGLGTIWPVVILVAAAISGAAVFGGTLLGCAISGQRRR